MALAFIEVVLLNLQALALSQLVVNRSANPFLYCRYQSKEQNVKRESDHENQRRMGRNVRLPAFNSPCQPTGFYELQPRSERRLVSHVRWAPNNPNQIKNSVLAQVEHQDINSALQSKGLQMVEASQNPDIIVTSNGGMQEQTSYSAWGMRGIGGGMGAITPEQTWREQ